MKAIEFATQNMTLMPPIGAERGTCGRIGLETGRGRSESAGGWRTRPAARIWRHAPSRRDERAEDGGTAMNSYSRTVRFWMTKGILESITMKTRR
jgi:hypothetical protein